MCNRFFNGELLTIVDKWNATALIWDETDDVSGWDFLWFISSWTVIMKQKTQ